MPFFERDSCRIHYDVAGDGDPVLTIAPGGMRSAQALWEGQPWDPHQLTETHAVIGMDQRNAGSSTAPVSADDGWSTYTADQLALLDHLEIERCHLIGMCIGGPYIIGLLLAAPERFASAVLLQPVGISDNRAELRAMFDDWAATIADDHPETTAEDWANFKSNMWDGEFVLTATPEQVATIETPLLVAMGNDVFHPQATSRQIVDLAADAALIERWREPEHVPSADRAIRTFLADHPIG